MDIFLQCEIVEQSGHGVPLIVDEYSEKAFDICEDSITVTIPFDKKGFDNTENFQNVCVNVCVNLNKTQNEIYILINKFPNITYKELAKKLEKQKKR